MAVDIKLKRSHTHSSIPTTSDLAEGEFAVNTYDGKMFMRDGSNNIVTVGSHYTTDFEPSTKTFYVTVATSASGHVHHGSGSSNKYKINGVFSPFLRLIPGITYRFDQSDSSNSGHPFRFYLDENKSTAYTTGVTTNGTAGSSGAYTQIVVSHSTPSILHYQCSAHGLMGWAAFVNTSSDLVKDVSPQLGGNLDVNAKNINFGDSASSSDDRLNFGAGTDLSIYHDGSDNTIKTTSDLNFDASGQVVVSGTTQYETKDFVVAGSRTGTGGAVSRIIFRNRGGSTDINASAAVTKIEGWRIQSNTPSLTFNFDGTERHRFDPDGKVALGAVPSSFGTITETVEITGTLKTTSTAKLTGVQLLGGLDLNSQDITGTGNINTSGNLTLTSTDAGSSAAPELSLVRDSSSPADADYLGQIRFLGDDDGGSQHVYAKITGKIQDASAGTEDGLIEFANVKAGSTTITARLRSDSLQLLNGTGLTVAGNTTLSGTLNGHTIPSGSGTLALTSDISASGISNVVEDTTPQLGGDLASNGNNINMADNDIINVGSSNELQILNNGTNSVIRDVGSGSLSLQSNGSEINMWDGANGQYIAEFNVGSSIVLYHNGSERLETTSTSIQINNAYTLPAADGNANQVITTDGSGSLSFASVGSLAGSGIQNLSDDTSPQLGGNLDVVTHSIVSTSNRDINITPNGSGKVVLDGLSYPTADGSNGQVLTTDGSGTLTFADASGGGSGENVSWSVTQSSHGLAVGDVIYNNGTNYVKAQANATGTLGLFVVSAVADANTFTATFSGKITLSSLTAGQYYFVSTTTAGAYVTTEPTSGYSNPILFALSTTEAVVLPYRPQDLTAGGAAGARTALDVFSKAETNQQVSAFAIALG